MPVLAPDQHTVLGMVNVAEVLSHGGGFDLPQCIQPALTLSGYESAANALVKLQQSGMPMAMVTDPRNEFVGIVTLKDVVDEIFGELPAW
jgi:CBS domain containing-hemolysin-like protein